MYVHMYVCIYVSMYVCVYRGMYEVACDTELLIVGIVFTESVANKFCYRYVA